ncbi:hypothetical protein [Amycolatopsis magusensis]|uniref:hypothetical protein n=1 Tax=Amycolatopsis magusensis TaxID=882444 RepID=UPI0037A655C6
MRPLALALTALAVSAVPPAEHDPLAEPINDVQLDDLFHQQTPTSLDPLLEHQLVALAGTALIADIAGHGRDRFVNYLPGPPPARAHTDVRVQAGVARQATATEVDVQLVWAGTDPTDRRLERQHTTIRLAYGPDGWRPVAP